MNIEQAQDQDQDQDLRTQWRLIAMIKRGVRGGGGGVKAVGNWYRYSWWRTLACYLAISSQDRWATVVKTTFAMPFACRNGRSSIPLPPSIPAHQLHRNTPKYISLSLSLSLCLSFFFSTLIDFIHLIDSRWAYYQCCCW